MTYVELHLLGRPRILRDRQDVELPPAKALVLLACLALEGRAQPRARIQDLLWADSLPDAARKNLRNTLWQLRSALGESALVADGEEIVLADAVWVDAAASPQAAEAARRGSLDAAAVDRIRQLGAGELLAGVKLVDAADAELWLASQRERLRQEYIRLLTVAVDAHRAAGAWQQAARVAEDAVAADPLLEPMVQKLMEAYARLGRRAEALRQFDRLSATLARELGVNPLAETVALRDAIVAGESGRDGAPSPVAAPAVAVQTLARVRPAGVFVGRGSQLSALTAHLQAAHHQAQVALLTGEMGIGKTRLWQEWSSAVPQMPVVALEARCLEATQSLPYAPLTALFRRTGCAQQLFGPGTPGLDAIWLAELARLFPEIRAFHPQLAAPPALPADEERHRLFEALTQLFLAIAPAGLVLFLDDVQWIDATTGDWLAYFVDRLRERALLLVLAYRAAELAPALAGTMARWLRDGVAHELLVPRLVDAETAELMQRLGMDAGRAAQVQARGAGNPLFLLELSRATADEIPPQLAALIRLRIKALPAAVHQVVQAAAILGGDGDFATLRPTAGRSEEETLAALDCLMGAAILREERGQYVFAHPLIGAVVEQDLSLVRRSFLHRRAAEALLAVHGADRAAGDGRGALAGRLARHYAQAGQPAEAARYAELAADQALKVNAFAEAVAFWRTACDLEPTPARRLALGRALVLVAAMDDARAELLAAMEQFAAQADAARAAAACLALAETYLLAGRGDLVVEWAGRGLSWEGWRSDPEVAAQAHFLLAAGGLRTGLSLDEAEAHVRIAAELTTGAGLQHLASRGHFELGNVLAQRGDLPAALDAYRTSAELARAAGDLYQELLCHNNLAYHALLAGDLSLAHHHLGRGLAMAEQHSLFWPRQYLYSTAGEIALAEGDPVAAGVWFDRSLAEGEQFGNALHVANVQARMAEAARRTGDPRRAVRLLSHAKVTLADHPDPHLAVEVELALAEAYLDCHDPAAARLALDHAETMLAGGQRLLLAERAARVRTAVVGDL